MPPDELNTEALTAPQSPEPPATPQDGTLLTAPELLARLADLSARVDHLTATMANHAEQNVITGMPAPAGAVRGMRSGVDQITAAVEAMLSGVRPSGDIAPLTGIRELYTLLSGDFEMTGRFNPDRVYLANVNSSTMAGITANAGQAQ